jgi:ubiquinone/menaquinone biosynthesis C-methylase UbiE
MTLNILNLFEEGLKKKLKDLKILDCGCGEGAPLVKHLREFEVDIRGLTLNELDRSPFVDIGDMQEMQYGDEIFDLIF